MHIRPMQKQDLNSLIDIQLACYQGDHIESLPSFAAKLKAAPAFCWVAEKDNTVLAYAIAMPNTFGTVAPLDAHHYELPSETESLYLHDIAVSPAARKLGLANVLLDTLLEKATDQQYQKAFLVAVEGASSYWQRHGFMPSEISASMKQKLARYGDDAVYMHKNLS